MFFMPGGHKDHGLPHNPFKSLVAPRPIGWITTLDEAGVINLAPYSFFNAVSDQPPIVFFAPNGPTRRDGVKDSQANAKATGEFVCNIVSLDLKDAMNATSAPVGPEVDESQLAGLEMIPSKIVAPPRVAASPVHLECKTMQTLELPCTTEGMSNFVVFGEVVGIHIDESVINDKGLVDVTRYKPLARLGYMDYSAVTEVFSLKRPE